MPMSSAIIPEQVALLQIGDFRFDLLSSYYELTGVRSNYANSAACGLMLESTDYTYQVYLNGCTMAESEELMATLQTELDKAPNLYIYRRVTPDATLFRNAVKAAKLEFNSGELRAMFTGNNTLSLIMTLTVLGEGGGNVAAFRQLKYLAANGDFDWPANTVKALLYLEGSSVPEELYAESLADFVYLNESVAAGYARVTIAGQTVVLGSSGVELLLTDPTFAAQADEADMVAGLIIYKDGGSEATRIPLFLVTLIPYFPDNEAITHHVSLAGLF